MPFVFQVNGEAFSLQTQMIFDDLSGDQVSREEIELLATMLAERFVALKNKTLIVQGLSTSLSLAILLAAWRVGLKVALVRADAFRPHFEAALSRLGPTLHFFYDAEQKAVRAQHAAFLGSFEEWFEQAERQPMPSQPFAWDDETVALIFFSSGSTGVPKGICHSLSSLMRSCRSFKQYYQIGAEERVVSFAELHTTTGLRTLALTLLGPSQIEFVRNQKGTRLHELMSLKQAHFLICGPYTLEFFLSLPERFDGLFSSQLKVLSLGSYLPPLTVQRMKQRFQVTVLNFYGLTETFGFALADQHTSSGDFLPPPCQDVSLALQSVAGERDLFYLELASPNLFLAYLGEVSARKTSFNTGDLVLQQADGRLRFMGRACGAAKAQNGEWIFPLVLETWLRQQEGVRDALVKVNPPLSAEALLSIFIDHRQEEPGWMHSLTQKMSAEFGPDYHSVSWHPVTLKRSVEGKVERLDA